MKGTQQFPYSLSRWWLPQPALQYSEKETVGPMPAPVLGSPKASVSPVKSQRLEKS